MISVPSRGGAGSGSLCDSDTGWGRIELRAVDCQCAMPHFILNGHLYSSFMHHRLVVRYDRSVIIRKMLLTLATYSTTNQKSKRLILPLPLQWESRIQLWYAWSILLFV